MTVAYGANKKGRALRPAFHCDLKSGGLGSRLGLLLRRERSRHLLHGVVTANLFNSREFPGHPVQRALIELALGIGLLRLVAGAVKVADHFRDRHEVAGVDLLLVLLRALQQER